MEDLEKLGAVPPVFKKQESTDRILSRCFTHKDDMYIVIVFNKYFNSRDTVARNYSGK